MARAPKPLPPPTDDERRRAGEAARALRKAIADPSMMGAKTAAHVDLARPRRGEWWESWANLPGFHRINGKAGRYIHALLPGWSYTQREIRAEMIPDLEALAERGERPTEDTREGSVRESTQAEILAGNVHPGCMCGRRFPDTPWDARKHCGFCAPPPEPCECGETSTFDLEAGVWREPACPNCT